jgi:FixJ family two-component response regulator
MEVTMNEDEEKRLLEGYQRLSPRNRHIALAQIIAGAEMEEIARKIAQGQISHGPSDPVYTLPGAGPVMGAQA